MRNAFGLTDRDMRTIRDIFKKYAAVSCVYIYGSRANGDYHAGSDIDLAVMDEELSDELIRRMKSDFEESSLPYFVDIVHFPSLQHESLKEQIRQAGTPFYDATTVAA
ncbi:MAG: nucleotidyltransferase domain-containing protein [Saprospiraceae bacterium]|nr:nucleotidyltransferase domain-containing protein [Saprospiraceae bacterium]